MGNMCMSKMDNVKCANPRIRRSNNININSINELRNYWKSDTINDITISDKENIKRVIHKLGI